MNFLAARSAVVRIALVALALLLPTILFAQDVSFSIGGTVSLTSSQIYSGRYVIRTMDYGIIWVDTVGLTGGYVGVIGRCVPTPPPVPVTNLYARGDCNGIGAIAANGGILDVTEFNGQCTLKTYCSGSDIVFISHFGFTIGSFAYIGPLATGITDSGQAADGQGRTWTASCTPPASFTTCTWHANPNPTAPPGTDATATNLSAAGRADKSNYFGDLWSLHDTSSSFAPISGIQWNFNYLAPSFTVDRAAPAADTVNPIYFPCDPSAGGSIGTGAGCSASVGGAAGSYLFSLKATNQYGTNQYTPSPIPVAVPQIAIAAFSGGVLNVLTGGTADASATQGNPTAFNWVFNPGSIPRGPAAVVAVPSGATSFSLTVPYAGYSASVSGSVSQVDLVPAFTTSPNPVIVSTTLTLTNQMQKGPAATLNSVDYAIDGGSFGSLVTCPGSFCNVGGTVAITAPPAPAGNHTVGVRYNFTGGGGAQSLTTSVPFATIVFTASPIQIITLDSGGAQLACAGFGTCNLQTGTTYYLFDFETLPGGVTHPGTQWTYNAAPIGSSPGAGPVTWAPASPCSSGCTLQVTVGGVSVQMPITISGSGPPSGLSFYTVTPCRLFDTRNPAGPLAGPALVAGANRTLTAAGQCGIPATARALSLNVTVTQPGAAGDLRFFPGGSVVPLVSTINYRAGQSRANSAVAVLGAAGDLTVLCDQGAGTVQLILDVNGYFQ
jgi:hypothetical protein